MKTFLLRTALCCGLLFSYGAGHAQANTQKSKAEGTAVKSCCSKKEAKETAAAASYAAQREAIADCPLKGTPDCPLVRDCPLKGTPDCPLAKAAATATPVVKKPAAKKKAPAGLPACCQKGA